MSIPYTTRALSLLLAITCSAAVAQTSSPFAASLMPQPSHLTSQAGSFPLTASLTVSMPENTSPRLTRAIARMLQRIDDKADLSLTDSTAHNGPAALQIVVHTPDTPVQTIDEDESYHLTTTPTSLRIEAATTVGALHALETLFQLIQPSGAGYVIPALQIDDNPRFRWRGLMIDCGRHFEPLDALKRNLDAMAAVKLNVFHWHLTEDQGFRIESKLYPKLTGMGSDGNFYTQQDARDLVAYARDRGIRVVPEFEMPGHSAAWLFAYPEFASGTVPTGIRRQFGVSDTAIDPTREETYQFIARFLGEMTTLFPDAYLHIGGDETPAPDWKTNPRILAFMKAHDLHDNEALQAFFNRRILTILSGLNRRMVGWDEIYNPALPKDVVIQSWRGDASLAAAAANGYQGVLSAPYYLDGMKPASAGYLADPIPADTKLTPAQQKFVLGGEVCMWAEQLDSRTLDSRVWPRTAAIAERFWSPQSLRDVDDMYRRLEPVSLELQTLGLHHLISEDTRLRDLADTEDMDALRTVAGAFEPVSFGERYQQQHTSQLTPLTNFVDAVRPDPPIRHRLIVATRDLLANPHTTTPSVKLLRDYFKSIADALPSVQAQLPGSPRLQPLAERLQQLAELAIIAQQAIDHITTSSPAPSGWKPASLAKIEAAKKPSAIVRFLFLEPLTDLVNATH